jgi:hypothetical protein
MAEGALVAKHCSPACSSPLKPRPLPPLARSRARLLPAIKDHPTTFPSALTQCRLATLSSPPRTPRALAVAHCLAAQASSLEFGSQRPTPSPLSGRLPDPSKPRKSSPGGQGLVSHPCPAVRTGELAEIASAVSPPLAKDPIARPQVFPRGNLQTKGISLKNQNCPWTWL